MSPVWGDLPAMVSEGERDRTTRYLVSFTTDTTLATTGWPTLYMEDNGGRSAPSLSGLAAAVWEQKN